MANVWGETFEERYTPGVVHNSFYKENGARYNTKQEGFVVSPHYTGVSYYWNKNSEEIEARK